MKNRNKLIFCVLLCVLVLTCVALSACDFLMPATTTTINFDPNYEGATVDSRKYPSSGTRLIPEGPTRTGYTFDGWFTDKACTTPMTQDVLNKAKTGTTFYAGWTAKEPPAPLKTPKSITASYGGRDLYVGHDIDNEAVYVTVTYTDDSMNWVPPEKFTLSGYDAKKTGEQTVTVSYTENGVTVTTTFTVEVLNLEVTWIEVYKNIDREVCLGDEFEPNMLTEVVAHYNNGNDKILTYGTGADTDYTVTNFNTSSLGVMVFQVSFDGKTESVTVEVKELTLRRITATYVGDPIPVGRDLDPRDFEVIASYNNGTQKTITYPNYSVGPFEAVSVGNVPVIISYTDDSLSTPVTKEAQVSVQVVPPAVDKLEVALTSRLIDTNDPAPHYNEGIYKGDALSTSLFVVTATYSDESTAEVTDYVVHGFDTSSVGNVPITFSYGGATKEFTMVVQAVVFEGVSITHNGAMYLQDSRRTIDYNDLSVYGIYSDGHKEAIPHSSGGNGGYTVSGFSSGTPGDVDVTVTYSKDGKTYSRVVTVTIYSEEILGMEAQYVGETLYDGDELLKENIKVWLVHANNVKRLTTEYTIGRFDNTQEGEQRVTITYNGDTSLTTELVVNVVLREIVEVEATYDGNVMKDEAFDVSKLTVILHFNNGTSTVYTGTLTADQVDTSETGVKTVQVHYYWHGDHYFTIDVKVVDPNAPVNNNLSIHFLELGNKYTGDSVFIKAGDTDILIDAGSREDSAETIHNYIKDYCTDGILEYVIVTHAHQDHIAGFPNIFNRYQCVNIIDFSRTNATTAVYRNYKTARDRQVEQGANHFTALECYNNSKEGAQRVYNLTEDGSIKLEILYQEYYEKNTSNENNFSVCVMISQGDNHYLFTGDLEGEGEESLVNYNPSLPHMQLWKGGHHGSYTAASTALMSKIQPETVCICTCMGTSEYTTGEHAFPAQEFCDRVAPYTDRVYVTTYMMNYSTGTYKSANGNIKYSCIGGEVTMTFSGNDLKLKDTEWFRANRRMPTAWANGTSMYRY